MLKELREKPKAVRQFYAFWGAVGITSVIASVWLVALVVKVSYVAPEITEGTENTAGAFSQFFDKIKGEETEALWNKVRGQNPDGEAVTSTSTATSTGPKKESEEANVPVAPVLIGTTSQQQKNSAASASD